MFQGPPTEDALAVMITIRVEGSRALPSGDVLVDEAAPMPFAGWLQLLGILSGALAEDPASVGLTEGLPGELNP
jgi:hypothetical protein